MDGGMKGFPAAGAGLGQGKEREVGPSRPCGLSCVPRGAALATGSVGLSFGSGLFQAGGTRPAVPRHLQRRGRCRRLAAGPGCGSTSAPGLFVELEKQAAGPNNRSHSWSGVPSSVWVALLRQHLLPHVFLLAFPGKLLTARNPTVVQRKGEASCISDCPGTGFLQDCRPSEGGRVWGAVCLAVLVCPGVAWRARVAERVWDGVSLGPG